MHLYSEVKSCRSTQENLSLIQCKFAENPVFLLIKLWQCGSVPQSFLVKKC